MSGGNHNRAFLARLNMQDASKLADAELDSLSEGGPIFYFQYNPKEFKLDDGSSWEESKEQGQEKPLLTYKQGTAATVGFDVLFDTTDTGVSVEETWVKHLRNMLSTEEFKDGKTEPQPGKRPPFLIFGWNAFKFICVLEKLGVTYMMFKNDGTPLRAKCTISLKEIRRANEAFEGGGSDDAIKLSSMVKGAGTVVTRPGDSVTTVAKREGVDAKEIIKANPQLFEAKSAKRDEFDSMDFSFEVGTVLVIPRNDVMAAILAAAALAEVAVAWASSPSVSPFDPNLDELPQTVPSAFEEKNPLIFKGSGKYTSDNEYGKVDVAVHFDELDRIKANTGERNKFDEHKGSDKYKSDNEYGKVDVEVKFDKLERIKANTGERNKFEKHNTSDKFKSDNEYIKIEHKDAKYDKIGGAKSSGTVDHSKDSDKSAGKGNAGERHKFEKQEIKTGEQKSDNKAQEITHKESKQEKVGGAESSGKGADHSKASDASAGKGAKGERGDPKEITHKESKRDEVGGAESSGRGESKSSSDNSAGKGEKGESKHSSDASAGKGQSGGGKDGGSAGSGSDKGAGSSGADKGSGSDKGSGGGSDKGSVSAKEVAEQAEKAAKATSGGGSKSDGGSGGGSKGGGGEGGGGGSEGSGPKSGGGSNSSSGGGGSSGGGSPKGGGGSSGSAGAGADVPSDGGSGGGGGGKGDKGDKGGKGNGAGESSMHKERPDAGGAGGDATIDLLKAIDEMGK